MHLWGVDWLRALCHQELTAVIASIATRWETTRDVVWVSLMSFIPAVLSDVTRQMLRRHLVAIWVNGEAKLTIILDWAHTVAIFCILLTRKSLGLILLLLLDLAAQCYKVFKQAFDPLKTFFKAINFAPFNLCDYFWNFLTELLLFLQLFNQMFKVRLLLICTNCPQ